MVQVEGQMKNSLRIRSLLVVFVTLSLVLGTNTLILTWGFANYQKTLLQNKSKLIGEHLHEQLDRAVSLGLSLVNLEGVHESCRNIIEDNKEIGYCMLVDTESRVLFHNDPLVAGRILGDPVSVRAATSTSSEVQEFTDKGVDYYDISIPVKDPDNKLLGVLRLGLKQDTIRSVVYPMLWRSLGVAFVTFLLASAVVIAFVSRKIVNPIVELSGTASLIAKGDLTRQLEINSKDEIGELAGSFNRMAESLQEREARIQQGYRDLEKANKDLQISNRRLESTASELELKSMHLKEKVGELSFLHKATDDIRATIELEDILSLVAHDVTDGLGYERVIVALVNQKTNTLDEKVSIGFEGMHREVLSVPLYSSSVFTAAVNEKSVQYIAQASMNTRSPEDIMESLNLREFAIIPMVGKDRCVGILLVDNRKTSKPMRKDKLDILATFASTAAMAVENSNLYRQLLDNLETVERANQELLKLDEAKTNFLSLASHELRTPLVSVMGFLNLMQSEELGTVSKDQMEMVDIALKGASRLRDIIEDLLVVAKIEGGQLPLKPRWISIEEVVKGAVQEVGSFTGGRNVEIRTESLNLLPKLEADFYRLHQCIINLVENAVKFTPDGGTVTITGRKVKLNKADGTIKALEYDNSILSSDTYIELAVEDTGIGIRKENLEKIFDKFFEGGDVDAHSTGKGKFMGGGTGLGLSIARGIVEGHNGRIWAESDGQEPGSFCGSRLVMLLPIKQPSARTEVPVPARAMAARDESVQRGALKRGSKQRVLLIEDDEDTIVFTKLILEKKFSVEVAKDGFEGLRKAFNDTPTVILLDVWMRGMDGYEVCKILKENERTALIPLAMFTAAAQKHEMERGLAAGADDYITKPFTPAELLQRVEKLITSGAGVS